MALIDKGFQSHLALEGVKGYQIYKDEENYTHKALPKSKLLQGEFYTQDNDMPFFNCTDCHATAVAGIAAGKKLEGISWEGYKVKYPGGVAPDAELVMFILPEPQDDNWHEYRLAMDYALGMIIKEHAKKKFDVVSMSLHTSSQSDKERITSKESPEQIDSDEEKIREKIEKLYKLHVPIVAAAGNDGDINDKMEFPAQMHEVIGVGSLTKEGRLPSPSCADFYCYGEVCAPSKSVDMESKFGDNLKHLLSKDESLFLQKFNSDNLELQLAVANDEECILLQQIVPGINTRQQQKLSEKCQQLKVSIKKRLLMKMQLRLFSNHRGSSFAAPAIAGLICLIIQYAKDCDQEEDRKKRVCESTVKKFDKLISIIKSLCTKENKVTRMDSQFFNRKDPISYFRSL